MNRKFAVCAGINDYPGTQNDLSGCVNDARDWAALLGAEGYRVETLIDAEASHTAVTTELRRAIADAQFGDRVVFTYSGHGTWVPDQNGDESDGRDEAMCLHDFQSGGLLLDDEVQSIFEQAKFGVGTLILSDSCFSGTVSRFAALNGSVQMPTPRFIPPHTFLDGLTEDRAIAIEEKAASTPRRTASLISGCGETEYSYDAWYGSRANGAFTRSAIDQYKPGIALGTWFSAIRRVLPSTQYPQSPQLTTQSSYRRRVRAI